MSMKLKDARFPVFRIIELDWRIIKKMLVRSLVAFSLQIWLNDETPLA
jgi:hypothetical protein